ncbi:MAG TPA: Lrp/AsnC ligand binding domain-containing protein [Candidatus Nitrosotenuis sp.]
MVQTYILLSCSVGSEHEVLEQLRALAEIKDAIMTYGDYDIVAKIETGSEQQMDNLISSIRQLQKIRSTVTLHVTD